VFCNQTAVTGEKTAFPTTASLVRRIETFIGFKGRARNPVQIAFYGGNFLGLSVDRIQVLLKLAADYCASGKVDGIRFSTRPDTITRQRLDVLEPFPVATIELGVQSMDDSVLALNRRGHSAGTTVEAVRYLRDRGFEIGLQMMVGLPGEDEPSSISTAKRLVELQPDFVRIYPTVVLEGSLLAGWYRNGRYRPLRLEDAVAQVKTIWEIFNKNRIPVIRMGIQASKDLDRGATVIAGPYHPSFGEFVYSEMFFDKACRLLKKNSGLSKVVCLKVHPGSVSKMRGQKNRNIRKLMERLGIKSLRVKPDTAVPEDGIAIEDTLP